MRPNKNIYHNLLLVSSRIEPYHSVTLGSFLEHSPHYLEKFISEFSPFGYSDQIKVDIETRMEDNKSIDITLTTENWFVGIEVKTSVSSARIGQLQGYWDGLKSIHGNNKIPFVIYLTPPAKGRLVDEEFNSFQKEHYESCKHI
jgi:hypothetical protein